MVDGEVRIRLAEVGVVVSELERARTPCGVRLPDMISETGGPGRVRFQRGSDHESELVRFALAVNLLPSPIACLHKPLPPQHDRELVTAVDHVTAGLLLSRRHAAVVPDEPLGNVLTDPANIEAVDDILDRPDVDQAPGTRRKMAAIESGGGRDG